MEKELAVEVAKLQVQVEHLTKENFKLEQTVKDVKSEIKELKKDMSDKLDTLQTTINDLNQVLQMGKGSWKTLVILGSIISFVAGIATKYLIKS